MSEPKRGSGPNITSRFSPAGSPNPEMIDVDNVVGFDGFTSEACMTEGCSGRKAIDTLYENTSQDQVENPREGSTPAPVSVNEFMFPHRRF